MKNKSERIQGRLGLKTASQREDRRGPLGTINLLRREKVPTRKEEASETDPESNRL